MKKFCISYSYLTFADVAVEAKTKEAAIKKATEVLGDIDIDSVWEVKPDAMVRAS